MTLRRPCVALLILALSLRGTESVLTAHVEGFLDDRRPRDDYHYPSPPIVVTLPFDETPSQNYEACYNISQLSGSSGKQIAYYGRVIYSRQYLLPCRVELDITPCGRRPRIRAHPFGPLEKSGDWVQPKLPQSESRPAVPVPFRSIYIECPALRPAVESRIDSLAHDSMTNATGETMEISSSLGSAFSLNLSSNETIFAPVDETKDCQGSLDTALTLNLTSNKTIDGLKYGAIDLTDSVEEE